MLKEGVPVDCIDGDDITALFLAAQFNKTDVIRLLRQNGADVNKRSRWSDTPLHLAAINNHTEVIAMLMKDGASINITSTYGEKPIDTARRVKSKAAVRMLEQLQIYIIHYCSCFTLDSRG